MLFVVLSLLILLSWSTLTSKPYHIDNKEVKQNNLIPPSPVPQQIPAIDVEERTESASLFNFNQENFTVSFNESQAAIKEVIFKSYKGYKFPLEYGFLLGDKDLVFKKQSILPDSVTFAHEDKDKKITKRFLFSKSSYDILLEIRIQNLSPASLDAALPLFLGLLDFSNNQGQGHFKDVAIATTDKVRHLNAHKDTVFNGLKFLGLRDRYFCAIVEPEKPDYYTGFIKKIKPQVSEIGLRSQELILGPHQEIEYKFHIYIGPQELKLINAIKPEWAGAINYGTFDFISQILLQLLEILYKLAHNWGVAIIILSILIYFMLYPLTLKQMRSMKKMQALQPLVEELRRNYKDNPQRLNKEIMALYSQHKINPLSGCLPLLLQMPIFFALYQALMRSVVLKGASFLWIRDLSEPDRLFTLPLSLPILGNEVNILPIVMTVGMFIQQKISTLSSGSVSAEQQKLMMIIMPLMFGLIFYHMPAGLVLYWLINSILMLIYQVRLNQTK